MCPFNYSEVILDSERPEDRAFVRELCRTCTLRLVELNKDEDPIERLAVRKTLNRTLLFFDASTEERLCEFNRFYSSWIGPKKHQIDPNNVNLIVSAPLDPAFQRVLSGFGAFGSLLFRQANAQQGDGRYYSDILRIIVREHAELEQFETFEVDDLSSKAIVLDQIMELLRSKTELQERMIQNIITGVDELLLNAFIDAPMEREKSGSKPLDSRPAVSVRVRISPVSTSITVTDSHGAFNRFDALKKILPGKGLFVAPSIADPTHPRAGIGLALAMHLGASLSVVVQAGRTTEVTLTYKGAKSYKEFRQQFQSLAIQTR